jgi:hypothetical protein
VRVSDVRTAWDATTQGDMASLTVAVPGRESGLRVNHAEAVSVYKSLDRHWRLCLITPVSFLALGLRSSAATPIQSGSGFPPQKGAGPRGGGVTCRVKTTDTTSPSTTAIRTTTGTGRRFGESGGLRRVRLGGRGQPTFMRREAGGSRVGATSPPPDPARGSESGALEAFGLFGGGSPPALR